MDQRFLECIETEHPSLKEFKCLTKIGFKNCSDAEEIETERIKREAKQKVLWERSSNGSSVVSSKSFRSFWFRSVLPYKARSTFYSLHALAVVKFLKLKLGMQ